MKIKALFLLGLWLLMGSFVPSDAPDWRGNCNYALACIGNATPYTITYTVQWGFGGTWTSWTLQPGGTMMHWYTYSTWDNCSSPQLRINFDFDASYNNNYKTYDLDRYQAESVDCYWGKPYEFQCNAVNCSYIDLFTLD
ncbi:MAG TPA: hypothetical protein PKA00_09015 [Saprospiraceae bacterium]|nr:hypothetical protein [Saprospiraceae bacterium]HMQ83036.1 hypothetical protein [Saprospiraceae bacterium]